MRWTRLALSSVSAKVGLALLLASAPARADEAETRHQEGTALVRKGEHEAARIKLLQALALRPMPKTLLNLCVVEQRLRLEDEAIRHCRQFLAAPGADPATVKTVQDGILRELSAVTARLTVVADPGAKVELDGRELGVAPLAEAVDVKPGEHTAKAGGRAQTVTIDKGGSATVTLTAPKDAPAPRVAPAPPPAPAQVREGGSWLVPGVLAAGGAIGVGVGVVLGVSASGKASALDAAKSTRAGTCGADGLAPACDDLRGTYDAGRGLRTGSYVAYGVGGAALLGAIVVALVQRPWEERPRGLHASIAPFPGGLQISGTLGR